MCFTTLDLLNLSYQNLHLTTLLTYLGTGAVAYWFAPKHRVWFAFGITAAATFSYESLYLGIDVLFAGGHGFGITNIFQYIGTIWFTLYGCSWIIKPRIDKYLYLLLITDAVIWSVWLIHFRTLVADRFYADSTKTILTLAILLPYRGNKLMELVGRWI